MRAVLALSIISTENGKLNIILFLTLPGSRNYQYQIEEYSEFDILIKMMSLDFSVYEDDKKIRHLVALIIIANPLSLRFSGQSRNLKC